MIGTVWYSHCPPAWGGIVIDSQTPSARHLPAIAGQTCFYETAAIHPQDGPR
jgi:hypothetical protein